jgi:hypothetical protein
MTAAAFIFVLVLLVGAILFDLNDNNPDGHA